MSLFPEIITISGTRCHIPTFLSSKEEQTNIPVEVIDFLKIWYDKNEYIVVQTSGSTGVPKKIKLQKTFLAASAKRTLRFFQLRRDDRVLLCLPVEFIAGKLMILRALIGGLDLYCVRPSDDFSFLLDDKKGFSFVAMVVNQVQKLLPIAESFTKIETLLIGGSALPHSLETALQDVPSACFVSYGMTETATHIALRRVNGSAASPLYSVLDGITLSLTEDGRLVIDMEGLQESLITNDLAEIIEGERAFSILGRADNIIISGGIKYIPEEIEKKLEMAISQPFFISSVADEILGRKIVLAVEAEENDNLRQELTAVLQGSLSRYERPKEIIFMEEFLRTETGKMKRIISER